MYVVETEFSIDTTMCIVYGCVRGRFYNICGLVGVRVC